MKKPNHFRFPLAFILFLYASNLFAEISLPRIFCDNMVLQRETQVPIWGMANKNSRITLITSWNSKSYEINSNAVGKWKIEIETPSAGGPFEIKISDGKELKISNVLVGEVWVCSGQSNMAMPMRGLMNQPVLGSTLAILQSTNPNIRLFNVNNAFNINPLDDLKGGSWNLCEPEAVANFSATAYYFGLLLNQILDVPIGLISSSVGGTPIEAWMSKSALEKFDFTSVPAELPKVEKPQLTPTVLFNGMINPLVGFGIRGAIWYQGENNRMQPQQYFQLMPGLIQDWRNGWGIGDFPFYYVQIAPYNYNSKSFSSAYMREAQLKASTILPNTGMACILDLGEKDIIHPANKEKVSERLALLALTQTYGIKGISGRSPVYKSMKIEKSEVKLTFDHAPGGLTSYGNELKNFEIAGTDSIFLPAKAIITKEGITVSSKLVKEPLAVRYAFQDFVVGDLFGCNGFPVSSFRTDDWKY